MPTTEQVQEQSPRAAMCAAIEKFPGVDLLVKLGEFPAFVTLSLLIAYISGAIDDPNKLSKQLCLVCSHNIAIGYYFERAPDAIYTGFPHFGPGSRHIPVIRLLARFWSYEMVAIRFASMLRPTFIPSLFASWIGLIIPQAAVFAPFYLGGVLGADKVKNPISNSTVNGFPALSILIWNLYQQLKSLPATNIVGLSTVWVHMEGKQNNLDYAAIALGALPFLLLLLYKLGSRCFDWTPPGKFPANGKTFFPLMTAGAPCCFYLLYAGWTLADVHKVLYAIASFMPIWWVNCLGGIDLWIEEPLGVPARDIAFTPTWLVSHATFMLRWALDPSDYINRLVFITFMCPQMGWLNFYFRMALHQDWGTQLPIRYSYFTHWHMMAMELFQWWLDTWEVGFVNIGKAIVKDCPLHFTPVQFAAFTILCTVVCSIQPNAKITWALYSLSGPLNWFGVI